MVRILIFDGAPRALQDAIVSFGAARHGELFEAALRLHRDDLDILTLNIADGERLPAGVGVSSFDGVVITGSPLNVYKTEPAVTRQLEFAREVFVSGVPAYGSCWGLQVMSAALGGVVRLNPNGREVGIARNIALNAYGRGHPMFAGKRDAFDALCSHEDEVATLPDGATVLASNGMSDVQALEITRGASSFLGVQYHPEHTFATTAAILAFKPGWMIAEGIIRSKADVEPLVADLRALDADPSRRDIAWRLGLDRHVLDPKLRTAEIGNWLACRVMPLVTSRAAAA